MVFIHLLNFVIKYSDMRKIEVCCTSVADVKAAYEGGAIRVELCTALSGGGVTPSYALVKEANKIGIPINVLIRPREGDFCYSNEEVEIMLEDIRIAKTLDVNGFAIGALNEHGNIDSYVVEKIINEINNNSTKKLDITFHRAFDECPSPQKALEEIISLGCNRLLTSGCKAKAYDGKDLINDLVRQSAGRISIMPGSGINPNNIVEIENATGAEEFHSSARPNICKTTNNLFGGRPIITSASIVSQLVNLK